MKSADIGTLLPKSTEVARNRQVEQQRPGTVQQQFATEARKLVQHRQQSVQRSEASEKARVGRDSKGQGGRGGHDPDARREPTVKAGATAAKEQPGRESPEGRGRLVDIVLGWTDEHGE